MREKHMRGLLQHYNDNSFETRRAEYTTHPPHKPTLYHAKTRNEPRFIVTAGAWLRAEGYEKKEEQDKKNYNQVMRGGPIGQ